VLNVDLRHPAVLAHELASLDVLSGGRLEIGIGAGWNRLEYDAIGIPFDATGTRIARPREAISVLKGCFGDGSVTRRAPVPTRAASPWPRPPRRSSGYAPPRASASTGWS
jgi:alkanesulfonate monooxygenase SsuD/methylene tetrahydromethanopterin reductase-like flavin-dependent oxidoreductase (luciferase family)